MYRPTQMTLTGDRSGAKVKNSMTYMMHTYMLIYMQHMIFYMTIHMIHSALMINTDIVNICQTW